MYVLALRTTKLVSHISAYLILESSLSLLFCMFLSDFRVPIHRCWGNWFPVPQALLCSFVVAWLLLARRSG